MERSGFAKAMQSIAAVTGLSAAALWILYSRFGHSWILTAAISVGTTFYHFAMRLLVGWLVPRVLRGDALQHSRWFRPLAFEPAFYDALKVKKWKDRMPTYDPASFSLKVHSIAQVIRNCCVSEAVHEVIVLFSFLPICFARFWGALPVFVITSVLAALFDGCFVVMQRYNRPRLCRILAKKETKAL